MYRMYRMYCDCIRNVSACERNGVCVCLCRLHSVLYDRCALIISADDRLRKPSLLVRSRTATHRRQFRHRGPPSLVQSAFLVFNRRFVARRHPVHRPHNGDSPASVWTARCQAFCRHLSYIAASTLVYRTIRRHLDNLYKKL